MNTATTTLTGHAGAVALVNALTGAVAKVAAGTGATVEAALAAVLRELAATNADLFARTLAALEAVRQAEEA